MLRTGFYIVFILLTVNSVLAQDDPSIEQDTAVYSAMSMGTAWALTPSHLVTNYHVIDGVKNLRMVTSRQQEIPVQPVLIDKKNDLAVLKILNEDIQVMPLPLALTKPRLGAQVFTIGYPHPNLLGTSPKLTSGFISALNGLADDPRTFQVSVPVQAGNSGGPLINMRGEVVGVITSKLNAIRMFEWTGDIPQNVNYAIKVNRLSALIGELETNERVRAGNALKDQDLETLAEKTLNSVVIIAGDGARRAQRTQSVNSDRPSVPEQVARKKILVYSYMEPEMFYMIDHVKGYDDSISNYSRETANILKKELLNKIADAEVKILSGKSLKRVFYRLENLSFARSVCQNNKADNIFATYSEDGSGVGTHFRLVNYRIIDCKTYKDYKREYKLESDELNDGFGYEGALYVSFADFLLKLPPYIGWEQDNNIATH